MPRRNERGYHQPSVPTYDEWNPPPPKPLTYTDKKGRVWVVDYLRLGVGHFSRGPEPWDATHRGFTWGESGSVLQQRVYRFQQGDDRSLDRETIYKQLLASKKVPSHAEHAERQRLSRPPSGPTMTDRIQEQYSRRGMGRR
jgi:hypothetical protein